MRILASIAIAAMTLCAAVTSAAASTQDEANVRECMRKTGAPGAYKLPINDSIPQVSPADGGTTTGAQLVNDCLLDVYQVQFARVTTSPEGISSLLTDDDAPTGLYVIGNCGRGSNVIRGGSGYCRD